MEKIAASLLATAGIACAQTYNYDSSSETLVITGKGNTVADRITLEGPITPGSTVPGTSEIFGDTKEIILKTFGHLPIRSALNMWSRLLRETTRR